MNNSNNKNKKKNNDTPKEVGTYMTSARDELYNLAENEGQDAPEASKSLTKDDVSSAMDEYFENQKRVAQETEQNERQRKMSEQRAAEQQELSEVSAVVKQSLQDEMSKDKQFADLVQKSDLPASLIDYIAEVGEADEAALIVREIAGNDEYQQKLKRSRTEVGVKRLLSQVRKSILMGGAPKVPDMIKKDIPNYNYNNSSSDFDQDYYAEAAMHHGI